MRYQVRGARVYTPREFLPGMGDENQVDVSSFTGKRKVYKFRRRVLQLGPLTIPLGRWQEGIFG